MNQLKNYILSNPDDYNSEISEHIDGYIKQKGEGKVKTHNLTDLEALSIYILQNTEDLIQEYAFGKTTHNHVSNILVSNLDSALTKLPKPNGGPIYRNDRKYYWQNKNIGDRVPIEGFFTCSKENFENREVQLTIELKQNTNARELFHVYDHIIANTTPPPGTKIYPEYQIEFPRNTTFCIKSMNSDKSKICLVEI